MLDASSDAYIRKFDHNGNFIQAKKFGDEDIGSIADIAIDDDNNMYFTGYFTGTLDFDPGPLAYEYTSAGSYDVFITKWDASGNMIWYTTLGGTDDEYSKNIELGADGNIVQGDLKEVMILTVDQEQPLVQQQVIQMPMFVNMIVTGIISGHGLLVLLLPNYGTLL